MVDFMTAEDAKKLTSLKILYTINAIICSINILFDYYLVKATIKNRSLHKPCPILIAVYFLCQLLWSTSVFIPYAIVILPSSILDSVTMQTCAIINFVPVVAYFGYYSLILLIGFDRLLSVYFPIWYSMYLPPKHHMLSLLILGCIIPLYISTQIIENGIKYGNDKTKCTMAELLRDQVTFQGQFTTFTTGGTAICYLAIFVKFICKNYFKNSQQNGAVSPTDLQVLKAVGLILATQILMWTLGATFFTIFFNLFNLNTLMQFSLYHFAIILGSITSILSAVEVPIIYFTSSIHRVALNKELN